MSDIKISNELLSLVFECECEFVKVTERLEKLYFKIDKKNIGKLLSKFNIYRKSAHHDWYININSFVKYAKIKAIDNEYSIIENHYATRIYNMMSYTDESIVDFCNCELNFNIGNILLALEWVAEKVGLENGQ